MSTNAPTANEPNVAGFRVRQGWSIALYALLAASAAVALFARRSAQADATLAAAAPWVFLAFGVGFAVYRLALVMARRYSPFKAAVQILLAAIFFLLLLFSEAVAPPRPGALLGHFDARVRAQAAELAGYRAESSAAPRLVELLSDGSPEVRAAAHGALVRLNQGTDLGAADDTAARAAWKGRFP